MSYAMYAVMAVFAFNVPEHTSIPPPPLAEPTSRAFPLKEPLVSAACKQLPAPGNTCSVFSDVYTDPLTVLAKVRNRLDEFSRPGQMLDIDSSDNMHQAFDTILETFNLAKLTDSEAYLAVEIWARPQPGYSRPDYVVIINGTVKTAMGYAYFPGTEGPTAAQAYTAEQHDDVSLPTMPFGCVLEIIPF